MTKEQRLRFILAGLGYMGGTQAACAVGLGHQVVAVVDPEEDRRTNFGRTLGAKPFSTLDEALGEVDADAVVISAPTFEHLGLVTTAAKAGKDIFCQKPMGLNVDECEAMAEAVRTANVKCLVGQVLRSWPEYVKGKQILDGGILGKVEWVLATRLSPPPTWSWRRWLFEGKLSGGPLLDLAIHDFDVINWWFGMPKYVGMVQPTGFAASGSVTALGGWEREDYPRIHVVTSLDMAPGYPFTMAITVHGSNGTLELDTRRRPALKLYKRDGTVVRPRPLKVVMPEDLPKLGPGGNLKIGPGYLEEMRYFGQCLGEGKDFTRVTLEDATNAVRVSNAAQQAAITGETIALT